MRSVAGCDTAGTPWRASRRARCEAAASSLPMPRRKGHLLIAIAYHRHHGRAVRIDAVVLRAIMVAWNDVIIPRSWPDHGHPDDNPRWVANDSCRPRLRNGTQRPQAT